MKTDVLTVAFLGGSAVIMLLVLISIFVYEKSKKGRLQKTDPNDWLFYNFHNKVYDLVINKPPTGKIFGVDIDEYRRFCKILHVPEEPKKMIAMKFEGIFLFIFFVILAYMTYDTKALAAVFVITAFVCFYFLYFENYSKIKTKVKIRIDSIEEMLPRYLAILEKALDFPVEQAIMVTASRIKHPFTQDLVDCCHKVQFGAEGWQETLTELARVYQIDSFNGFVMDLIQAYKQGTDIKNTVAKKVYMLEQQRLYQVEQQDSKMKTLMFLPIMLLKILPLMALICLPMMSGIKGF